MITKTIEVTIVVPCWNCEAYIEGMLESVLHQTCHNWQAFFVDDRSTDNTAYIIQQYTQKDSRMHYILRNREPKGAQTCRNIGAEFAKEDGYICFFDADDIISPSCIENRAHYMDEHMELDFAIFPAKTFVSDIDDIPYVVYGRKFAKDDLEAILNMNLPMVVWTNIYRVSSLKKYKLLWDERVLSMQDSDFNIVAIVSGMRYNYAGGNYDYYYRLNNPHSLTQQINNSNHSTSHVYLLNKVLESISDRYKDKYNLFLRIYVLNVLDKIKTDNTSHADFLRIPWIRRNYLFRLKLLLYILLSFRGRRRFFTQEVSLSRARTREWYDFMNSLGDNIQIIGMSRNVPQRSKNF